ncbi:putative amidohydrolase [Caldalkalibacillus uzonensis]|uniref:Amidohydrolase n=1 Tax=Caldalkalibacillus uzonensis TaxID=353224 RepID=A0ABU0CPI3_9BACI|nr:carbon-nitrogen hydrolase family protein [Caldalkalibacillus uzonensis]MDQ0337998.1 putative amidohydrolase [Caldalkalibacillus uzonensis]
MQVLTNIAAIQTEFTNGYIQANLNKMRLLVRRCQQKYPHVHFILFPELAVTGYFLSPRLHELAENAEGPAYDFMADLSRKHHVYLGYGFVERGDDPRGDKKQIYNSFNVISPNGERLATYQKIHLTPLEKDFFDPGQRLVTIKTEIGNLGLMICWDLAFPELARLLVQKGANVLLAPSAWELPYDQAYYRFSMARAIDNTAYLITCNHVGESSGLRFFGKSAIFYPDGTLLHQADDQDGSIIVSSINLAEQQKLRFSFYSMSDDRRTDLYTLTWNGE